MLVYTKVLILEAYEVQLYELWGVYSTLHYSDSCNSLGRRDLVYTIISHI